ncbi:MAG: XRE family transcriptional regulator [Nitrospira sp.]|nr:XRE family transcriptional regulator [Nitrospira sp.]
MWPTLIKGRSWKQVEVAAQRGIDQAKVSKLLAGQMAGFSIERLVRFLSLLCQDIEMTVRTAMQGKRRGTVWTRVGTKLEKAAPPLSGIDYFQPLTHR